MPDLVLTEEVMCVARTVCTARQIEVLELRRQGVGWKLTATIIGIDRSTVRAHFDAAMRRLEQAERGAAA